MTEKITVQLTGFKTKKQAEEFVRWYCEAGEQDSAIWFDDRKDKIGCRFISIEGEEFPLKWNDNTLSVSVTVIK